MSDHDTYVIRASADGWSLLLNGQNIGSFARRDEAEEAARVGAEISHRNHRPVQVFIQDEVGSVQLLARTRTGSSGELELEMLV
jgi:hypothetical protein